MQSATQVMNCSCGHSEAAHARTGACAFCSCGAFGVEAEAPVYKKEPNELDDALAKLAEHPAFGGVTVAELLPLAERGRKRVIMRDTVLLDKGEASDRIYFILHGQVAVQRPARGAVAELDVTLGPGDVLGEIGFLHGSKHTATAVAVDDLRVLEFSQEDVRAMFRDNPDLRPAFLRLAHQRVQEVLGWPHGDVPEEA